MKHIYLFLIRVKYFSRIWSKWKWLNKWNLKERSELYKASCWNNMKGLTIEVMTTTNAIFLLQKRNRVSSITHSESLDFVPCSEFNRGNHHQIYDGILFYFYSYFSPMSIDLSWCKFMNRKHIILSWGTFLTVVDIIINETFFVTSNFGDFAWYKSNTIP